MTRFIFVRHAQSIANDKGVFIGHIDWDLSELGFRQAQALGDYLTERGFKPDVIYSSDLLRPCHTIEPFAKAVGMEIVKNRQLREIYAGDWEGRRVDDLLENEPAYQIWKQDIGNSKTGGGESVAELYARISAADPRKLLERGFTLALDSNGVRIKVADGVRAGDKVSVLFPDGTLKCTVDDVERE